MNSFREMALKIRLLQCYEVLWIYNSDALYVQCFYLIAGVLSMKYHQLTERGSNPLVISKDYIDTMFAEDQSVLLLD